MTSRRELIAFVLGAMAAAVAAASPQKDRPLEVTYYFLPG